MNWISENRARISFVTLATIGFIGGLGQLWILHNTLVHSFPFKVMNMPPADFYSSVGRVGYYVALASVVIAIAISARLPRFLVSVLPVAVCPLIYWLVFELAHILQGFSRDQMIGNFDGYTGNAASYEFGYKVLVLMFFGTIIGSAAGLVVTKVALAWSNKLA